MRNRKRINKVIESYFDFIFDTTELEKISGINDYPCSHNLMLLHAIMAFEVVNISLLENFLLDLNNIKSIIYSSLFIIY